MPKVSEGLRGGAIGAVLGVGLTLAAVNHESSPAATTTIEKRVNDAMLKEEPIETDGIRVHANAVTGQETLDMAKSAAELALTDGNEDEPTAKEHAIGSCAIALLSKFDVDGKTVTAFTSAVRDHNDDPSDQLWRNAATGCDQAVTDAINLGHNTITVPLGVTE